MTFKYIKIMGFIALFSATSSLTAGQICFMNHDYKNVNVRFSPNGETYAVPASSQKCVKMDRNTRVSAMMSGPMEKHEFYVPDMAIDVAPGKSKKVCITVRMNSPVLTVGTC